MDNVNHEEVRLLPGETEKKTDFYEMKASFNLAQPQRKDAFDMTCNGFD